MSHFAGTQLVYINITRSSYYKKYWELHDIIVSYSHLLMYYPIAGDDNHFNLTYDNVNENDIASVLSPLPTEDYL